MVGVSGYAVTDGPACGAIASPASPACRRPDIDRSLALAPRGTTIVLTFLRLQAAKSRPEQISHGSRVMPFNQRDLAGASSPFITLPSGAGWEVRDGRGALTDALGAEA